MRRLVRGGPGKEKGSWHGEAGAEHTQPSLPLPTPTHAGAMLEHPVTCILACQCFRSNQINFPLLSHEFIFTSQEPCCACLPGLFLCLPLMCLLLSAKWSCQEARTAASWRTLLLSMARGQLTLLCGRDPRPDRHKPLPLPPHQPHRALLTKLPVCLQ